MIESLLSQSNQNNPISQRQISDMLIDDALALMEKSESSSVLIEQMIAKAIAISPDLANSYFALHKLYSRMSAPAEVYQKMKEVWASIGCSNLRVKSFVDQFADGFPYQVPSQYYRDVDGVVLLVAVSNNLEAVDLLEFYPMHGEKAFAFVGRIQSPNLVCSTRDLDELPNSKMTILEDLLKKGKDHRIVSHRNTWVKMGDRKVFGPAIDTVLYNENLHRFIYSNAQAQGQIKTIFEMGVGTGFLLSSAIKNYFANGLEVLGSDVSPNAIQVAQENLVHCLEGLSRKDLVNFRLNLDADGLSAVADRSIDLLFTNPPYIPEYKDYINNPYEGTKVIEDIMVNQGPRVLSEHGVIVCLYSSLCQTHVDEFLKKTPLQHKHIGVSKKVPLDLREISRDPSWLHHLREHHRLEVQVDHPKYLYWHDLHMVALYRDESSWEAHLKSLESERA